MKGLCDWRAAWLTAWWWALRWTALVRAHHSCILFYSNEITFYADDFTFLASAPSIIEADAKANLLTTTLVRCANRKQHPIASQKSSVTLFTSDIHQPWLRPQVSIGDEVAQLNRILKSWASIWTHSSPLDSIELDSRALYVMKALPCQAGDFRQRLDLVGNIRPYYARYLTMLPHLVQPSVLLSSGQTWGDP